MIKRLLLIATMAIASANMFAADLIGTWNVMTPNNFGKKAESTSKQLGQGLDFSFGILGTVSTIQFKEDGTFFCNDSIYGTYTYKDDQLILTRDEKLVNKVIDRLENEDTTQEGRAKLRESFKGYECDSLFITFSKQEHKALIEGNQQRNLLKDLLPFNITFIIDKQGTNGKEEDLNEGKSLIGKKYKMSVLGIGEITFSFMKKGKCIAESIRNGKKEEKKMVYSTSGYILTIHEDNKSEDSGMRGEYIFCKEGLLFIIKNAYDGTSFALNLWEVK